MFNNVEVKLLRMALDKGALEGEVTNAAIMFIKSLRKRDFKFEDFQLQSGPDWSATVIGFGKHKGKMLKDIEPSYLLWLMGWIGENDERRVRFESLSISIAQYMKELA